MEFTTLRHVLGDSTSVEKLDAAGRTPHRSSAVSHSSSSSSQNDRTWIEDPPRDPEQISQLTVPPQLRPPFHAQRRSFSQSLSIASTSSSETLAVSPWRRAPDFSSARKRFYPRQMRRNPSCDTCRERRVKCDATETSSCSECFSRGVKCQFTKETNRRISSIKQVQDLEMQMAQVNRKNSQLQAMLNVREGRMDIDTAESPRSFNEDPFLPSYTPGHTGGRMERFPVEDSPQSNPSADKSREWMYTDAEALPYGGKTRRRAEPPGLCHVCNIAPTSDLLPGPNGRRTFCGGCGVLYVTSTPKNTKTKSQGFKGGKSSPPRPKSLDEDSTWIAQSSESVQSLNKYHSKSSKHHVKSAYDFEDSDTVSIEDKSFLGAPLMGYGTALQLGRSLLSSLETASELLEDKLENGTPQMEDTKGINSKQMAIGKRLHLQAISQTEQSLTDADSQMTPIDAPSSEDGSATAESAWMSDYSGNISQLNRSHPLFSIKSSVVRTGLLTFQNLKQRQHAGAHDAIPEGTSNTTKIRKATPLRKKTKNHKSRADDEESRESEDDEERPAKRPRTSKRGSAHDPSFACPFAKKDPLKYRCCYAYVMKRIRDVKQHLSRFHQLPIYCPLCMCTFDAEDERDVHIRATSCSVQPTVSYEGVTRAQKLLLGQRVSSKMTLSDQWFTIFDILFPGHSPRPKSAYMNVELTVELEGFQDLMYAEGPRIISTAIRSSGIQISTMEDSEGDSLALLELAIEDGLQQIAQRWSTSLPNTYLESRASQAAAADESLSPNPLQDIGRLEPSRSSSHTLFERSPETTGLRLTTQDVDTIGDDEDRQINTQRARYATQDWDEWSPNIYQQGDTGSSNTLAQDGSNREQRHRDSGLDNDMGNRSGLWEMINQEEWNNYGDATPDTSQIREDGLQYGSQLY